MKTLLTINQFFNKHSTRWSIVFLSIDAAFMIGEIIRRDFLFSVLFAFVTGMAAALCLLDPIIHGYQTLLSEFIDGEKRFIDELNVLLTKPVKEIRKPYGRTTKHKKTN